MGLMLTVPVFILSALFAIVPMGSGEPPTPGSESFWDAAEALRREGSYGPALDAYRKVDRAALGQEAERWLDFRIADCTWRSRAATEDPDDTATRGALEILRFMAAGVTREKDRDLVWAEIQESLGDAAWQVRSRSNWSTGWSHYSQALSWWAGSREIEVARVRYLAILRKADRPVWAEPRHHVYGNYGNNIPVEALNDALGIAREPGDAAWLRYLLAMGLRNQSGNPALYRRTTEAFEAALEGGREQDWYDDALYHYAGFLHSPGRPVHLEEGGYGHRPEWEKAVELYRRVVGEFKEGETRYRDDAQRQIKDITGTDLTVLVSGMFLPGSRPAFDVAWRNVDRIALSITPLDLGADLRPDRWTTQNSYLKGLELAGVDPVRSWTLDGRSAGRHNPGRRTETLDEPLPEGAYLLLAEGGGQTSRELLLVTRTAVILKVRDGQVLAWVADALDGKPVPGAKVHLFTGSSRGRQMLWDTRTLSAGDDGVARAEVGGTGNHQLLVTATAGSRQALGTGHVRGRRGTGSDRRDWRMYVFSDRPAYRPGDTVQFKTVARIMGDDGPFIPDQETLDYKILDSRGTEVSSGQLDLNRFGSGWDELTLDSEAVLGEYRIRFKNPQGSGWIYGPALFRLEEYKLPEFKVTVSPPLEDGAPVVFRPGDMVEAEIAAEYYFGGPVAGATAVVTVRQAPLYIRYRPEDKFAWLHEPEHQGRGMPYIGSGSVVQTVTVTTGEDGTAQLSFPTEPFGNQDLTYTIEARVTDASRREVTGTGRVRVTRQPYFVFLEPVHRLFRPGERVAVDIRAKDGNDRPAETSGTMTVYRERWEEIWTEPGGPCRKLQSRGYRSEKILDAVVVTDAEGKGEFTFTPGDNGYYRMEWSSEPDAIAPVTASTTVWVTDSETAEIGYRTGGVEILLDRATFTPGESATVMLASGTSVRHVLFGIDPGDLDDWHVVAMDGSVKLLQVEIRDRHTPNIFLDATLLSDTRLYQDVKELVVPPVRRLLNVSLDMGRESYLPGETINATVTTLDNGGKPVPAEVALGVVDAAVYAIQADYAPDPRQFFYGDKRSRQVRTGGTFAWKRFLRPEPETETEESEPPILSEGRAMGGRQDVMAKSMMAPAAAEDRAYEAEVGGVSSGGSPLVVVRTDFRATAFWQPDLVTGDDGTATVELTLPETLTEWTAKARALGSDTTVGIAQATTRTRKPLLVRLQAPRFLVAGDQVTISGIIHNNTGTDLSVRTRLSHDGLMTGVREHGGPFVSVPAGSEARVDWNVRAEEAGEAELVLTASAGEYSDGMSRTIPVHVHGVEKFLAASGASRSGDGAMSLNLPQERKEGSTTFTVRISPSLAASMLDALPYLIDYPYGCVEQTMSRFLPAVLVRRALVRSGVDAGEMEQRLFGGEGTRKLDDVTRKGIRRLADMQHGNGAWGWWKESSDDEFMTAYVIWGLAEAKGAGIRFDDAMLRRAAAWLDRRLVESEERPDDQAWLLHALSAAGIATGEKPTEFQRTAFTNLWQRRERLNAYTRALLTLTAARFGETEKGAVLVRNLSNGVIRNDGTAHWGNDGIRYRWSSGGVEATAFVLRALLAVDPDHELIDPTVRWLANNRRGAQWSNTRDTAIVVMAFTDFLEQRKELASDLKYRILVNGREAGTGSFEAGNILDPGLHKVEDALLKNGENRIVVRRLGGEGPMYYSSEAVFFSLEEPVTKAGNEIHATRDYYRRKPYETLLAGTTYDSVPLIDHGTVTAGEVIEVVLTLEAKNHYEYLIFEDLKPAGLEAAGLVSGQLLTARRLRPDNAGIDPSEREDQDLLREQVPVYQELRDRKVVLFIDRLPEGFWEIRYRLRAEVPGRFHGMPVLGHAMYVPEIRCNGEEIRLKVEDR